MRLGTFQEVTVAFPNTKIGNQLKQVARLIKKRTDLQINRQVFFVELRGFDTHQNQLNAGFGQTGLLAQVSQAMRAFYDEMVEQGLEDQVTSFTLSDFGRTMEPSGVGAGVGTDHGWGNHMFVMGGAVQGGNIYGSTRPDGSGEIFPNLLRGGPDDIDTGYPRGRWLPTTGVEQYAATLSRWFGLTARTCRSFSRILLISRFRISDSWSDRRGRPRKPQPEVLNPSLPMKSDLALIKHHVEALFIHDEDGRLVKVNEPGGGPAPRSFWEGRKTDLSGDIETTSIMAL